MNIEVQLASELAIAAIEKNGGVVTTAFYDPRSLGKSVLWSVSSLSHIACCLFASIVFSALSCSQLPSLNRLERCGHELHCSEGC